jgi:hypothetical protein
VTAELHPACEPLAFLLGTWRGEGHGEYPSIASFDYGEEVTFTHAGKPFLVYSQMTWSLSDNAPMHSEMGFWRPQAGGVLEIVLAHPFGLTEVSSGTITGHRIETRAVNLISTPTAKEVEGLTRTFEATGDQLVYSLHMATGGHSLQNHLGARLRRA